ncbi:MAG TPA: hypothetical protein DCE41_11435 [Cytophagales bacterium]|nr:hypothetical protein [Cytophagales bacterium]HAA22307.1 hypothetical protein [Cytophagales bacterium]HAP60480.1 hypothetical protein [Cytophagales bacterium]
MNWKLTLGSLVFFGFGVTTFTQGQQVLEHEKKVFTDDDGTIYWNRGLPVYIRLSPTPGPDAPAQMLNQDTRGRYVDAPYYFDTEGPNYIRTRYAVDENGNTIFPRDEVLWEIQADGLAPSTTIRFSETRPYRKDGKFYFKGEVTISLTGTDGVSGIENLYYSINGQPYKAYTEPVKLTDPSEYNLKVYGVDRVGNVEEIQERNFIVDDNAPQSKLDVEGDRMGNVVSGRTTFSLAATDDVSGLNRITFRIDEGPETTYTRALSMNGLAQGEHIITYRAYDMVANTEEEQRFEFYVDRDPPLVTEEILGDVVMRNGRPYVSGRAQVKLAAIDNKAGLDAIYYSTDDENFQKYERPFYLNSEAQQNGISYYAIDKVGNRRGTQFKQSQDGTFANIDLSGPTLAQRFQGPRISTRDTIFIGPATKIILLGSDPASGMDYLSYSINGGDETRYEPPFTIGEQGHYDVDYFGYDAVGNRNRNEFTFFVDATAPEILFNFDGPSLGVTEDNPAQPIYPTYVNLFLSAKDNLISTQSITYSINGGSYRTYSGPIRGFAAGRSYEVSVRVSDPLGNQSTASIKFTVAE